MRFKQSQFLFMMCWLLIISPAGAQSFNSQKISKQVTLLDELSALYDISTLPVYRSKTISAQISSYDTTGGNEDYLSTG
jgi:hypothetical protein